MDRRKLTQEEMDRIADHHAGIVQPWDRTAMRTHYYKFLVPDGEDLEIRTVAVRYTKGHYALRRILVKEIAWASVMADRMYIRDVAYAPMAGYCVDWSKEGQMRVPQWVADGWFGVGYEAKSPMWKFKDKPVINREEIQQHPRFKYCQWYPKCGDLLDFLKVYLLFPRVELLVKAGLEHLACRTGFLSSLENDKGLMRFVSSNIADIRDIRAGVDAIRKAKKDGTTVAVAQEWIDSRRQFHGCKLPSEIDAAKALAYIRGQKSYTCRTDYARYAITCKEIGLDLLDTKVAFPRNFKLRLGEVQAVKAEAERRKDAAKRKVMNKAIASVAVDMARLENVKGPFAVVLPNKEADLKAEGKRLHHCIGNGRYAEKIASKELVVAFIRRKRSRSASFVTVSFNLKDRKVEQCYGQNNSRPEKSVMDFINGPFQRAAKRLKVAQ
jgi:hypothetical protein